MGIKFRCPNGHKLNVKSFLAGKRGVCPDCGSTFRIPPDDGAGSDIRAAPLASKSGPSPEQDAATLQFDAQPAAAMPVGVAVSAAVVPVGTPVSAFPSTITLPAAAPAAAQAYAPAPVPAGGADPIAEAPAAIWYVRPPGGQQYGPARGDNMRKWIAEGRVSGDSLVWREGWTDWRSAAQVFASLGGASLGAATAAVSASATNGSPIETATASRTPRATGRFAAKKKSGSGLAIAALALLVVACLALLAVLVVVLVQKGG